MSKLDYVNGKWTFRATPLDYLHCIFNEYEWLLLLKGRNKPYESILDPLHEIAQKERYEDEELVDTVCSKVNSPHLYLKKGPPEQAKRRYITRLTFPIFRTYFGYKNR